jgi:tetratricopeptide (TPR) repeat protein
MQCPQCNSVIESTAATKACPKCGASLVPAAPRRSGLLGGIIKSLFVMLVVGLIAFSAGSTYVALRTIEQRDQARKNFAEASRGVEKLVVVLGSVKPAKPELLQPAIDYYQEFLRVHANDKTMLPELAGAEFYLAGLQVKLGSKEGVSSLRQGLSFLNQMNNDPGLDPETIPTLTGSAMKVAAPIDWVMVKGADQLYATGLMLQIATAITTYEELSKKNPQTPALRDDLSSLLKSSAMLQGQVPGRRQQSLAAWIKARDTLETLVRDRPDSEDFKLRLVESLVNAARMQKSDKQIDEATKNFQRAVAVREQMVAAKPDDKTLQKDLDLVKRELEKVGPAPAADKAAPTASEASAGP